MVSSIIYGELSTRTEKSSMSFYKVDATASHIASLFQIRFMIPRSMPIIVPNYHTSRPEFESVVCDDLNRLLKLSDF